MTYVQSKLFKVQLVIQSVIIVLIYVLDVSLQWQAILGGICLCLVGIPHGANDHLYRKDTSNYGMVKFLAIYVGSMVLYLAVWWLAPALAFILFFAISFHHFGQSNFENTSVWHLPSILWGLWILAFPVLLHFHEAIGIFGEMISFSNSSTDFIVSENALLSELANWQIAIASMLAGLYVISLVKYERKKIYHYLLQFALVSLWYLFTPLLFGFIVVFCLWHASQSLQHQANHFQNSFKSTVTKFLKAILPLSLISLLGFAVYVYFREFKIAEAFILLSLISLPHIVVMHRLYSHGQTTAEVAK